MYYTKQGKPALLPQTEEDRFAVWVEKISDWRLKAVRGGDKVVGTGIAEPTPEELAHVYAAPCRYRRAARAGNA
jgi:hypothetical protein